MIKLGIFYHQLMAGVNEKGLTFAEAASEVKKHGIDYIDADSVYLCREGPEAFAEKLKSNGLDIISVHGIVPCDVSSEEAFRASVEETKHHMELAKRAGSKFYMVIPAKADTYVKEDFEKYVNHAREIFKVAADYGKEIGIQATVENFSLRDYPYTSFDSIDWILSHVPEMRYTFDSGNYTISGFNEVVGAKLFYGKTVYAHLKDMLPVDYETVCLRDGVYYEKPVFGEGIVRNDEIIDYYTDNAYEGVLTVEYGPCDNMFEKTLRSADIVLGRITQRACREE